MIHRRVQRSTSVVIKLVQVLLTDLCLFGVDKSLDKLPGKELNHKNHTANEGQHRNPA